MFQLHYTSFVRGVCVYIYIYPLVLQKLVLCFPFFAWVVVELCAADPSKCPKGHEQMLVQEHNLRLLDDSTSWGISSTWATQGLRTRFVSIVLVALECCD